jgi:hypothetical protein
MERDSGMNDGREATGGIGPPGSLTRRRLLQGAAAAGLMLGSSQLDTGGAMASATRTSRRSRVRAAAGSAGRQLVPPVNGLHLQFGADASNEVVVTWQTYAPVQSPQVDAGRSAVPSNGASPDLEGLWYSFRAGSVKVIAINNDDVCLQDAGDVYVHGYSQGAQKAWLERELASARRDRSIDWVVVCMHQVAMSTAMAPPFNGADLGIPQEWMPLFDQYGVDLVVAGHEHHYERELPVRGTTGTSLLTPQPVPMSASTSTSTSTIDTTLGTQHMIIGGGGTSAPSNTILTDPPVCQVITSVGPGKTTPGPGAPTGHFTPNYQAGGCHARTRRTARRVACTRSTARRSPTGRRRSGPACRRES